MRHHHSRRGLDHRIRPDLRLDAWEQLVLFPKHGVSGLTVMMTYMAFEPTPMEILVASLPVTAKGEVTLKRDLLLHLGLRPGERVDFEKLPGGKLRVPAAGTIEGFLHGLDGKMKLKKPLSIENINRIAAAGWAGDLDDA